MDETATATPFQLRRFLQTQPLERICDQWIPELLTQLRRDGYTSSHVENLGGYFNAVLLSHAPSTTITTPPPLDPDSMDLQERSINAFADEELSIEAFFEQFKPKSSSQVLCGYLFQRNDIVFNCKTCQQDETCVVCLKCFQNGNHEGHDVFFHRTSPGGVCDCGDPEAWAPEGFCVNHGRRQTADNEDGSTTEEEDEAAALPAETLRIADALFNTIVTFFVEMAKKSMDVFDAERVNIRGQQALKEFKERQQQQQLDPTILQPRFHVRICNDDVHSDEDLIRSLTIKRIPKAADLVRSIDSNGSEIVAPGVSLRDALGLMQDLKLEGWHVCVVQDEHIHDESVLLHVIRWVKTICSLSRPLHVMFCDKLFATTNPLSSPKEPIQVMFLSDPYFRKEIVLELYELYLKLQGDKDPKMKFSMVFFKVYNRMMSKYFCGIGTREESLFQYGVQILTTPSVVNQLAQFGLLDMLLDTINIALDLAKAPPPTSTGRLLSSSPTNLPRTLDCEHSLLKFKRYYFVIEHLGYVLGIPSMSSEILMRKDVLRKWFDALRQVQGLDPHVRIQDGHAHVTYETQTWFTAFNFHANVNKISTFISKGLRYHEGDSRDKEQMVNNVLECFWEELEHLGMAESALQLYTPPFGSLMGSPRQEKIVKFDVESQPVSFHNPLHGMLASFLLESISYGPPVRSESSSLCWISDWKALIEQTMRFVGDESSSSPGTETRLDQKHKKTMLIYGMMEFPLRSLVLSAQIHCGLWIRNGQTMQRQMINYMSPPWCSELRDLDVFLIQISASIVGFTKFLTIYFDRFGLSEWLLTWINSRSGSNSRESRPAFGADEKLVAVLETALLSLIWIVTELPPPLKAIEEQDTLLRREIIHRLSQHPCRLSELLDQTTFTISTPFGGVAARQEKQHLARLEHILDEVAEVQFKRSSTMSPLLHGDDDIHGEGAMEPVKYTLKKEYFKEYDPAFYHLSRSSHEKAQFARQEALFKNWKVEDQPIPLVEQLPPVHESLEQVRFLVLEKGLLGIMRLILEDAVIESANQPKQTNVMVVLRAIHLLNLVVLVLKASKQYSMSLEKDENLLSERKKRQVLTLLRSAREAFEDSDGVRGKKRVKRQQTHDGDGDISMSSDSDQGEMNEVQDLSIIALLVTLSKDQIKNDFETAKSTISAIYWILKELSSMDAAIHTYVELHVWSGMKKHEQTMAENGLTKAQLRKLHQQRAIEAMMARQKAFAQSSCFAEMNEEEDEDDDMTSHSNDDHGEFNDQHDSTAATTIVYRPPPPPDCIICSQKKKDDPIMYIGHAQMSQVTTHALQEKPFDSAMTSPSVPFPPQIFMSLCGHAVHLYCWKKYFASVKAQSRFNLEHSQSNIAFDAHFGEFLCPLCQALSSMLVPYLPLCRPLTLEDRQKDRQALERVFQSKQDTTSIRLWLSEELPSRLEALETEDNEDDDSDEYYSESEDDEEFQGERQKDEVRAMKQFAMSVLETLLRFQPEMTTISAAVAALKKGFYSTGPQLAHLIWSAVASTITSCQLSGISSAIHSLEALRTGKNHRRSRPNSSSSSSAVASFSSLRITSILNPPAPSLKTRLAVSLPEELDSQLDILTPKDDSKMNILLRSLRRVHFLFKNRKQDFYHSICVPIQLGLRLSLTAEEWMESLALGPPMQLGQPLLGQDLFYLCVAICSSMLHTKAEILLTIRSFCVLYMAQVLLQISRMPAEDFDEETSDSSGPMMMSDNGGDTDSNGDNGVSQRTKEQELEMQRSLEQLMDRLSDKTGVVQVVQMERDGAPYAPPRGTQLMYLFKSSCSAFMRQVTLLCRAFFRGEQDPDESWCANFVSSLRLSTNYHDLCQQLGLPTVDQILADTALMQYLEQAALLLQHSRFASVPDVVQDVYKQNGEINALLHATHDIVNVTAPDTNMRLSIIRNNLNQISPLPLRIVEDSATGIKRFYFANVRLVRLAASYTDLHSDVLGKSKCKQTWRMVENPAICLVCEQVLCAGTECCRRRSDGMGACTHHAITCGYGVGMFFLLRSSSVLLVFGPRSSYFGSPYLDMFGEEDINVRRGRPLHLSTQRMKALLNLYSNHQLANEVARNRRTSDQYIRNNYY